MKLVSWNVNGIRAVLNKGFHEFLATAQADIVCLQETKAREEQVGAKFDGYFAYWNSAERPGVFRHGDFFQNGTARCASWHWSG